jgi:hypothetical protein
MEISRRMLLKFVTFEWTIMTSEVFHRTDLMAIDLDIYIYIYQIIHKRNTFTALHAITVLHLLNSGKHITVSVRLFMYNYFCTSYRISKVK